MNASFYTKNRHTLYESLPEDTILCVYAGGAIRKTADEDYPVYTDTNFLYLTGIEQAESVLFAVRHNGETKETLFTLPPDFIKERWTGKRRPEVDLYPAQMKLRFEIERREDHV